MEANQPTNQPTRVYIMKYIKTAAQITGLKVKVYFNLHKKCYSIKAMEGTDYGRVIYHAATVQLDNATFHVSEAGRQRVITEKRKNVHAGIVGIIAMVTPFQPDNRPDTTVAAGMVRVSYNPYKAGHFVNQSTDKAVHEAATVLLCEKGGFINQKIKLDITETVGIIDHSNPIKPTIKAATMATSKRKAVLSIAADTKTVKGQKLGFLTGILYLAPSDTAKQQNVCPMARKAGCEDACLYTAGRGVFSSVQQARINKTMRFFNDHNNFMMDIVHSINILIRKAERMHLTPLVRLNGTSDIMWERVPVGGFDNIMAMFPNVTFYDYTKFPSRKNIPSNYDLTFSYSGVHSFAQIVNKAKVSVKNKAMRMAVVFDKKENIPATFLGFPVISGDESDVRHIDDQGVIIALYAKGAARKDLSGFVVRA